MCDNEKIEHVRYDDDKMHCWINGGQWISLNRLFQIRKDYDREMSILAKEIKRLTDENESYRTLFKSLS